MDFQDEDPYALLEEYYQELYEIARLNLFDSMAHITYPIRYMNGKHHLGVDLSRMDDLIDLTLRTWPKTAGRWRSIPPVCAAPLGKPRRP